MSICRQSKSVLRDREGAKRAKSGRRTSLFAPVGALCPVTTQVGFLKVVVAPPALMVRGLEARDAAATGAVNAAMDWASLQNQAGNADSAKSGGAQVYAAVRPGRVR